MNARISKLKNVKNASARKLIALDDPISLPLTLTIGGFLKQLMDSVQQIIISARNAGNSVAMEAGAQVGLAITNAQNAYQQSLNETIDKVDAETKTILSQFQSMVNDLTSNVSDLVNTISQEAQQIVNSLPFSDKEPQVTQVTPHFVVPATQSYPVKIDFSGNFVESGQDYFSPVLLINGNSFSVSANTTQKLSFLVPVEQLTNPQATTNQFDFTSAILTIPWESGWWIFATKSTDTFSILIGILPASLGKIQIIRQMPQDVTRTQLFTTQTFSQHSDHDDDIDHPYTIAPDVGWSVVRNTVQFTPVGLNEGEWHWNFDGDYGNVVRFRVTTIHHGLGTSGKIDWIISFQETRTDTVTNIATETVELKWGDSKSFDYAAGTWKVVFDAFDGSHHEFNGSDLSNPFLKIQVQNGALVLSTADPKTLQWP